MLPGRLKGRVALVTGISSAIGARIAERLVCDGAMTVVGVSRKPPLSSDPAILANFTALDILDEEACASTCKNILQRHGPISLVVHAAGVNSNTLLIKSDARTISSVLETNVSATLSLTKQVLRHGGMLSAKQGGSVVFLGSTVGVYGNGGQVAYAASKGALSAACLSLSKEYSASSKVRFNVVAPGLVDAPGMAESVPLNARQSWLSHSCLRRLVTPDDVADSVICLSICEMLNGHTLVLDGGRE